ncbi:MAG: hypothetical protein EOM80_15320 [Erysipelotrichia bacterium]|nr:hypothetical protein [Erysipelotrichia bacterium]
MKKILFTGMMIFLAASFIFEVSAANADDSNPFNVEQVNLSTQAASKNTSGSSVAAVKTTTAATSQVTIGFVNVNTRLNVRTKPWGKIIGKLYDGDKLRIIAREGDWLKIHYNGKVAYVHSDYVEIGNSRSSIAPSNGDNKPTATLPDGTLDPARFGYDSKRFSSVFDVVEKFCSSNKAYVFGAGHTKTSGYAEKTDCSGFVGQFIQKLAAASGIPPVFPVNSWYPTSQNYKTSYTKKITSSFPPPNPRDSIKPGDVFVMNPGSSGVGHVGLFMGYTSSGQPIIAHSTPTRVQSRTRIAGKVGYSGVRIEVLPARYASRWAGVYRIKNMDQMLNKLSGS